jgi:hypothetical protein
MVSTTFRAGADQPAGWQF